MNPEQFLKRMREYEQQEFMESLFPKIPIEAMTEFINNVYIEADKECRQLAEEDPIQKYMKEIYIQLHKDAFDTGLTAELAEFYLDNPDLDILEINRQFRNEWDI